MPIIFPQLDGVKINEDRSLPIALIQAIRKAYEYIATGGTAATNTPGGPTGPTTPTTGPDAVGPVTGFTSVGEVGDRYVGGQERLVHMTLGFIPICPVPQSVTYLVSSDNGANWVWIGSQRMLKEGQMLLIDQLAPGQTSTYKIAAVAGNLGGTPTPLPDLELNTKYPGVIRSVSFTVVGLATPAANMGITATIGTCHNVISADGFTQYGVIPGLTYTDPVSGTDFFVRVTVEDLDAAKLTIAPEQPHGGTQITGPGNPHTLADLQIVYIPGLAFERYRFYTANRNSQGPGDFANPATNTLQLVKFNGSSTAVDHYDVPITIPPFTPINPDDAFNVTSVTASEIGPKYQDVEAGLHTVIGVIPVIDHDYSSPRTVTIWFDFGNGQIVWQGWYALTTAGQTVKIGEETLGTDGVRKSGDIWVPANVSQGGWKVWCGAGKIDKGIDPTAYAHFDFTVIPLAPCLPNGTTQAQFISNPATGEQISYSKYEPGVWYWGYYEMTWAPPSIAQDPNYWFTLVTVQKGATISGVWTPAPDKEGANQDPNLNFLGTKHVEVRQLPGVSAGQTSIIQKFGVSPSDWVIPVADNTDLTPNPYRDFRFLLYNVSRLGTDPSGSGGSGTYTLQTSCWPGNKSFYILTPVTPEHILDIRAANPATIELPLTGGNGLPLTVQPGAIGGSYLADQAVHANHMAEAAITEANKALAAAAVVDGNVKDVNIVKVTAGTQVFTGDLILSRGLSVPILALANDGLYLYGVADNVNGKSGLTNKPYTVIQNAGIGLYGGGSGATIKGSVFIDGATSSITIYSKNADLTFPYMTVNATGIAFINGTNSMAINANAMVFLDLQFHNRIDISSAGIVISAGLDAAGNPLATASQVKLTNTTIQLLSGSAATNPKITISVAGGIVLSNGGTSSVTITSSSVLITNGSFSVSDPDYTINIDNTNGIKLTSTVNSYYFQVKGKTAVAGGGVLVVNESADKTAGIGFSTAVVTGGPVTVYGYIDFYGTGSASGLGTVNSLRIRPATVTAATAGSAVLPASPVGFLSWLVNGSNVRIPYYN